MGGWMGASRRRPTRSAGGSALGMRISCERRDPARGLSTRGWSTGFGLSSIERSPSEARLAKLLPGVFGHVLRDRERTVRSRVAGLLDGEDLASAVLLELRLDGAAEAADLATAAAEEDVVADAGLELRIEGGDEPLDGVDHGRHDRLAGLANRARDVELARLAVHGERPEDRLRDLVDEG